MRAFRAQNLQAPAQPTCTQGLPNLLQPSCSKGRVLLGLLWQVAQDAINDARSICMREYGAAPDVSIYGDPTFTFAYVPSHLHHMVFELVKNSLRAVQDRFEDADDEPPPIR